MNIPNINEPCTEYVEIQESKEDHSEEILAELKSIRRWIVFIGSYFLFKIILAVGIFLLYGSLIVNLLERIARITS